MLKFRSKDKDKDKHHLENGKVSHTESKGKGGGRFNLVQPSLIQQLRSILDQYQDDGQILKELVQNAEDAKATEVKFLLDETQHESRAKYLHHPELTDHQGPALYAYNNAQFTDNDWIGLKMINDSVKKSDAMKVGRFGLGFKSVFHMTDLPSVISAEKLSFIDPHEKFFVEEGKKVTGYTWHLKDDYKSMKKIAAQFDPYRGLFGCSDTTFKSGHYNGTMFRFPLRNKQSQLSNNLYNKEKVLQIFDSFQSIAEMVLLFLTSVESIELYRRKHGQMQPELIFKVQISPECIASVRHHRSEYLTRVGQGRCPADVRAVYPVSIDCVKYDRFKAFKTSKRFLISHFCAGVNTLSEEMTALLTDPAMNYIPWVGAAVELRLESAESAQRKPQGHVFCFLPLPLQKTSMSGLPVHINGFFAVSSNRHQLKWPSIRHTDNSGAKVGVTDKACLWNELVLEEVVPKSMFHLIMEAISLNKQSVNRLEKPVFPTAEFIYHLIPDPDQVLDRWKLLLPLLFRLLSQTEFIQSDSNGVWQKYQKVILLSRRDKSGQLSDNQWLQTQQVLLNSLILAGVNASILPDHLTTSLQSYINATDMFTSPELMRLVMRKKPNVLTGLSADDKILLLGYLLSDSKYPEMKGLPLLPLANGTFTTFADSEDMTSHLYIPSEAHPAAVLPMISDRFIDISNRVSDPIIKHLKEMAVEECSQLRIFTVRIFASLLPQLITTHTLLEDKYYGEIVWDYIQRNFPNASEFEGLPMIVSYDPHGRNRSLSLSSECPLLSCCDTDGTAQLDSHITAAIEKLGIRIVYQLPKYILNSSLLLDRYIYLPTAKGLKSVLKTYTQSQSLHELQQLKAEERISIRNILSKLSPSDIPASDDVHILKSLPLFSSLSEADTYLSANEAPFAAPFDAPPLPSACLLLDVRDAASKSLSELLGVSQISKSRLLLDHIVPAITAGLCSDTEVKQTMLSVLHNYKFYQKEDKTIDNRLRMVKCVLRADNCLVTVDQCYDPTDKLLSRLLCGEQLFPSDDFCQPNVIQSLKHLGLKRGSDVSPDLLSVTAQKIEEMSVDATADRRLITEKSLSLLDYIDTHTNLVSGDRKLKHTLDNTCWVVPRHSPPQVLPHSLPWYMPGVCAVSPDAITGTEYTTLVSSVLAILPRDDVNSELMSLFNWDQRPSLSFTIQQLKNVISNYRANEKGVYMSLLTDIYKVMSEAKPTDLYKDLEENELTSWVWHGDGFVSPNRIIIEKTTTTLSPYVYNLPPEMCEFVEMMGRSGAWSSCNSDVLLEVLSLVREKYLQIELFDKDEVASDLRLVLDIINQLKPLPGEEISDHIKQRLLVPVLTDNDHLLSLSSVTECTFCDTDWLRERRSQLDHTEAVTFVHPSISNELAEQLGVPSLVNRMLDTDSFELGESFGQSEPLTRRLHNLLKEYSDGFAVPKELLQNADDAGATEVRFMYDERTNADSQSCLIDDGMKECQGPALWVYNNAVFSDADFEAVIKLSGATKSKQSEKIGGFGLGFNAVYNLTDVPSFVSRNFVVIFDPHTTHLGKSIPDASKPGIKIDLKKNHKALGTLKNQFKPYTGVFGADLRHKGQGVSFDGTLFRFPLRNSEQARKSEISDLHYDREEMTKLLEMLAHSCDSLLLFTQNVRKVSVYHLLDHHEPHQANLLYTVSKEPVKYIRELRVPINLPSSVKDLTEDEQEFTRQSSILKAASSMLQDQRERRSSRLSATSRMNRLSSSGSKPHLPESSILMKVKYKQTREGCHFLRLSEGPKDVCTQWLVTSSLGEGDAMEAALKIEGLTPVGGVAVALEQKNISSDLLTVRPMSDPDNDLPRSGGNVFCYLPLPIKSGLPVHINGAFAVTSNRRHLVEKVTDNKSNQLVEWNHALMNDSVCRSYMLMLEDLKALVDSSVYSFYLLWPRVTTVAQSCVPLVHQFYNKICSPLTEQKLFSRENKWVTLENTVLLDSEIRSSDISTPAFRLVELIMASSSNLVLNIPDNILLCFKKAGCEEAVVERTLTRQMLFQKIVFPNLTKIPEDIRSMMILHALDSGDKLLYDLIKSHACIPATPGGKKLSFVQDLINPSSQLAVLYSKDDGRFPYGTKSTFLTAQRLAILEHLGMLSNDLPDTELLERAQSIPDLYSTNQRAAISRTCALLQYMDSKLAVSPDIYNDIQSRIRVASFLPVMKRPQDSLLPWAGEKSEAELQSPEILYPGEQSALLCYVEPIMDAASLGIAVSDRLKAYLGISKPVTVEQVLSQLKHLQQNVTGALSSYLLTKKIFNDIYQFIQDNKLSEDVLGGLGNFILIGDSLVSADKVVLKGARDCAPYLYELPYELHKYEHVFRKAGMRDRFDIGDYVKAIRSMYDETTDKELSNRDLQTLLNIATLLHHAMEKSQLSISEVTSEHGSIYLADASNHMVDAATLCFNDCNWLPDQQNMEFAHNLVPYQIAKRLGVNTKRQEAIRKHSHGIPFGQKEKLTKRLKRIMSSYPCGKEIFKELLQNADDAGATQIHFVKDCRHHQTEKVFEECWKPLQGPALCVYNNKPFSRSDLEGIQNLGEGSKGHDPNRTGQYGVGFNSVYHLTDSPSFLTNGPEVGEVLCAFDPQCRFVPGATPDEPGRMFDDLDKMKEVFTDVFDCYLPNHFDLQGGTMFRFPLRSKELCTHSKISNIPVTLDTISELMKKFRQEMFDVLLFVNNLEEISLSDITRTNKSPTETYTVKARVTQRYARMRREFTAYIRDIARQLKNKEITLLEVPVKEVSYKMTLEDSLGYRETWLVVQRIGYENPHHVPQSVQLAHMSGELSLLPRGGAACLLSREIPKKMKPMDRPKKVFCFLPLPIHTKLPVHINGHFALDHEARRGLWRDDDGGPRTDWNEALISQVICPAYKRLIESCKEKSFPSLDGIASHMKTEMVEDLLTTYHGMFPEAQQDEQWQSLVNGLYRTIALSDTRLFPVFNQSYKLKHSLSTNGENQQNPWEPSADQSPSTSSVDSEEDEIFLTKNQPITSLAEITWYPLLGQSDDTAFFMDESGGEKDCVTQEVCNSMIAGGFNLLSSPYRIYKAFETAMVQAYLMTPAAVIEFLKSNRLIMPELPAPITETPFHDIDTLRGIIDYCMKEEGLIFNLDDLPFGLAQDNSLHYLSEDDQLFYSSQYELVPECADLYLHCDLVTSCFPDITAEQLAQTRVFKPFGVEEFGLYINQALSDIFCPSNTLMVAWDPDSEDKPNRTWLSKIWGFLSQQTQSIISEYDDNMVGTMDQLEITLFALQSWCLLPVYAVPTDPEDESKPPLVVAEISTDESSKGNNDDSGKEGSSLREITMKLSQSRSLTNLNTSCGLDERGHFLVPLQHSHMVMDFSQRDSMTEAMRQALRKLRVPELHHKLIEGKTQSYNKSSSSVVKPSAVVPSTGSQLTRLLCAKVSDPRSVLKCLTYCVQRSKQSIGQLLHASECNLLLKYFSESIDNRQLQTDQYDECISELRTLPFYISLSGQQTELAEYDVYILPQGIPGAEIDVWRSKAGVLFLQKNDALVSLYSFLGCKSLTDIEVYCQFIFQHFEYLSEAARVIHLTYIRDRKLPLLSDEERDMLIGQLVNLKFIKSQPDGELHTASEYFDVENRTFQLMLDRDQFPPEPYDNYRWIRFLRMIGLNCTVSDEKFVEFAEKIAAAGQESPEADLDEKAKVLVHELFKKTNLATNDQLLSQLKSIPFLCATRVNSKYHDFSPQFGFTDDEVKFICFNDSLCSSKMNTRCSWTSAYFIPHWADPAQLKSTEVNYDYHEDDELSSLECYKTELSKQLGIKSIPSKEQMVSHIKNISKCVDEDGDKDSVSSKKLCGDKSELLIEVMDSVYKYLQQYAMDDEFTSEQLQNTKCVLIEEGKTLVKAKQLVLNLYEEQQIRPYLYKTPTELSNYNSLFRYLGATERATPDQYAAVLDRLYYENQGEVLHPNSLRCAYRAVKGLFSILSKTDSPHANVDTLYLPGQDACLRAACSLVYNDEPSYSDRLSNFSLPFLVDLRECKLQITYFNEIVRKLPEELRPLMLSDIVEECLEENCIECHSSYGAAQVLRSRLTSSDFTSGILRLIRHDHMERSEKPKATALKVVQKSLKNVRVHAVEELITYLRYDGEKIRGSESNAECFVTRAAGSGEWCLYVHTDAEVSPELLVKVAEIVNKIAGGLLQNSIIYLHPILSCAAYEIPITLDKLRIRQDHHAAKGPTLQPPGSFIPSDLHHLLKQDLVEFECDEYVGYELDDPEMYNQSGDATYIYATIIEKLPVECAKYDRNTQQFFDRYRINIGEESLPIIVSSLDLYRLHRVIERKPRNLSVSSNLSEIYNDSSVLQTESGDYLLLSPGGQSLTADLDQGVIVEEEEEDEGDNSTDQKVEQTTRGGETDSGVDDKHEQDTTTEESIESDLPIPEAEYEQIWEETTVFTELHVNTDEPDSGATNHSTPKQPKQQSQSPKKPQQQSGKAADVPVFDYPEICTKNIEEIKRLLEKQVRAIWKLEEQQRKKVIKRLMLKFHPDKNPDKNDLCTKLTQHIRVIIEDIEDGGFVADKENRSDWWNEFINRRAKAYGEQKNDFEEKLKETFSQYASKLGPEYAAGPSGYDSNASRQKFEKFKNVNKRNPVPAEARRWYRQACADLKSAYNDYKTEEPAYEWVLIKSHQAAEKALKSACYTLDSKKINLSDLKLISSSLHDSSMSQLAKQLQGLIGPNDHLTHPGNTHFPKIPHELIEQERATQVLEMCETMLERVNSDYLQVMERDLRGDTDTHTDIDHVVDNSRALVLVPKQKARARRNLANSLDTSESNKNDSPIIVALSNDSNNVLQSESSHVIDDINSAGKLRPSVPDSVSEIQEQPAVFSKVSETADSKALLLEEAKLNTQSSNSQSEKNDTNGLSAGQSTEKPTSN